MSRPCTNTLNLVRQCEAIHPRRYLAPCITLPHHQRTPAFSTSPWRRSRTGSAAPSSQAKAATQHGSSAQANKARQDELRSGNIPDDLGLLPDTFVMPSGTRRPSWISQFKQRLRLERARLKRRFIDAVALTYYRFGWHMKPKPRLRLAEIPSTAKDLHHTMYQQFAIGTLEPLQTSVVPGFLGQLRARIAQRPTRMPLRWKLHEYKSTPRLMSLKVALFPGPSNEKNTERRGLVQAVVRIHSLQSLHHIRRVPVRDGKKGKGPTKDVLIDARGRELSESEYEQDSRREAKESVEYVVIQKKLFKSKEGPWKIWGTTEETTLEKLDRESAQDSAVGV